MPEVGFYGLNVLKELLDLLNSKIIGPLNLVKNHKILWKNINSQMKKSNERSNEGQMKKCIDRIMYK